MPKRQNKKGRSEHGPPFVQLFHYLLDSPAWLDLGPAPRTVFVELVRRYNGSNNGSIALSVRDASRRCNINKDTATKAFRLLQEHGFIEQGTPGGFTLKIRHAAEWRLTYARCDKTGAIPSKGFVKWSPEIQNTVRK